jgi:hypothetical protein
VLAAVVPVVATALAIHASGDDPLRFGLGGLLSTSGTILSLPFLVAGVLDLLAAGAAPREARRVPEPVAPADPQVPIG